MPLKLIPTTPKKSLNAAFLKVRPLRSEIDTFKANLILLLDKIDILEQEQNQKTHVRDFLVNTYYKGKNEINTKGNIDLVIHTDNTNKSNVGVIIEAKRPSNKGEWITADKPNGKALQECVLYYLRERIDEQNIYIKNIIITNIHEWYIIDAIWFEKYFYGNPKLVKEYKDWCNKTTSAPNTSFFYTEIAAKHIASIDESIPCTYFDIRSYEKALRNTDLTDDDKLIELQKLLSEFHLLKVPFANDSNTLNNRFYKELLHIIGLEEVKDNGKQIICRKVKDASPGSMIENTINILKTENKLHFIKNRASFGDTADDQYFNVALELNLIWINRILFLKLLEGQLLNYHSGDKKYKFLHHNMVNDYDEIYKLFHQVLAVTIDDRNDANKIKYQIVPYLNSSLFDIAEIENMALRINALDDNTMLDVMSGSILDKYKDQKINPLKYLLEFLDAFDFASEGVGAIQEDNKSLINASILGKVFEKINGYKDGSIYTPGFITMYMCRQTIRKAVVQKFSDHYGWNVHDISDISNYIADRRSKTDIKEFNLIINTIRLCDPAVGSGHFLVSALNEIIQVKYELGILADGDGVRLTDYEFTVENDELIIRNNHGDIYEYKIAHGKPKSKEDQRLQQTLFHEKQSIIENCLFGVDINPNSVKICRLRLWIELLKNAYYIESTHYTQLETLPNIDINIKCGNSLISRFGLEEDISKALKSIKYDIKTYRAYVQDYKNVKDRESKRGIEEIIQNIKNDFRSEIGKRDKDILKLNALNGELFTLVNQQSLFETDKDQKTKAAKVAKLEAEINTLSLKIEEIRNNAIYRDAFEWRFEFPEVLDDDGNFKGFDLIVGNPPYIQLQSMGKVSEGLAKMGFQTYTKTGDIYSLFYELGINLISKDGLMSYITSNKWMRADYGLNTRKYISEHSTPHTIIDFGMKMVFDNATVYSCILIMSKKDNETKTLALRTPNDFDFNINFEEYFNEHCVPFTPSENEWVIQDKAITLLKSKVESQGVKLKDWSIKFNYGIKTGFNEAFIIDKNTKDNLIDQDPISEEVIRPILRGQDIKAWIPEFSGLWLINTHNGVKERNLERINVERDFKSIYNHLIHFHDELKKRQDKGDTEFNLRSCAYILDFDKPKIIYPNMTKFLPFVYDEEGYITNQKCFIITSDTVNLKYLTAFLNSKLFKICFKDNFPELLGDTYELSKVFFEKIPVKQVDDHTASIFADKVDSIIALKKERQDTTALEAEIDQLVYALYGLTDEEIMILEGK